MRTKLQRRKKRPSKSGSQNKKVRNATVLKYNGIKFKSKLELHCYKKLTDAGINFQYEEVKYTLLPSFKFENISYELYRKKGERYFGPQRTHVRSMTYTPDFVGNHKGKLFIIETKGNPNDAFPLKWKLLKWHLYQNNYRHQLFMPRNQKQVDEVVELIKQGI